MRRRAWNLKFGNGTYDIKGVQMACMHFGMLNSTIDSHMYLLLVISEKRLFW